MQFVIFGTELLKAKIPPAFGAPGSSIRIVQLVICGEDESKAMPPPS